MPWVIIDFKRDKEIGKIPNLQEIDIDARLPKHAGLYVVRPTIDELDDGKVTDLLLRIWDRENTGVFLDEGYMLKPLDRGLRTVLTQGRSKRVPVIALSQRPAWVSPFLLSESEFLTCFYLMHPADGDRMREWMPLDDNGGDPAQLRDRHSYWYQRPGREFHSLSACPPIPQIMEMFAARQPKRRFWL